MTSCPKCGRAVEPAARICPACGVIMAKVRPKSDGLAIEAEGAPPRPPRPPRERNLSLPRPVPQAAPSATPSEDDGHTSPQSAMLKVGLAAAAGLVALLAYERMAPKPVAAPALPSPPVTAAAQAEGPNIAPVDAKDALSLSQDDIAFLNDLSSRLSRGAAALASEADTERVEKLQAANRGSAPLKNLLMVIYLRRADRDMGRRAYSEMDQTLAKAKSLDDSQAQIYVFEAQAKAQQNDWPGALTAIQRYDGASSEATIPMSFMLALTLEKLGRRPDALAVLDRPVFGGCTSAMSAMDVSACSAARQMREALAAADAAAGAPAPTPLPRVRAALAVDPSKQLIQSEKFDVRFDGESQTGVARDVLFVLDRAYTRLTDVYYDRPSSKIPVVLHSSEDYYSKTGAPWWSGGVYSSHNGAIQIPIKGIPSSLPHEMEDVLVHELSHAFVDDMSGGYAGRDLQEGLAQYMEGKRIEKELGLDQLKRLAHSNAQSVGSFYMLSLAISEQLVQSRGQGMINQLLKAMKETGSEDGGFRKTFGQSGETMKKEILETFWRRYS